MFPIGPDTESERETAPKLEEDLKANVPRLGNPLNSVGVGRRSVGVGSGLSGLGAQPGWGGGAIYQGTPIPFPYFFENFEIFEIFEIF